MELAVNCRYFARALTLALPLTAMTACGLVNNRSIGLAGVDDLVTLIAQVQVDAELAKERVSGTVHALQVLVAPDFSGDPLSAYSDFVSAIELSEAQFVELQASLIAMKGASDSVFDKWQENLEKFHGEVMRKRSGDLLAATRQRYRLILLTSDSALANLAKFNLSMHDHALYLEHGFNASAIADIDAEIRAALELGRELEGQLGTCVEAARIYVESAALPLNLEEARDAQLPTTSASWHPAISARSTSRSDN